MDEQHQQRHRSEMDAHEVSRQLQRQLEDLQRTRDDERRQLLQRLEDQRATLGQEIKELRDRNAAVSNKRSFNQSGHVSKIHSVSSSCPSTKRLHLALFYV